MSSIQHLLYVPPAEAAEARAAGALAPGDALPARGWACLFTQHRTAPFSRWTCRKKWRSVRMYLGDGEAERTRAKAEGCRWDPERKDWYVNITSPSTIENNSWLRRRTHPPEVIKLRVPYEDRELAKACGARWLPAEKCWAYRAHQAAVLPAFVHERRIKQTTV